MDSGAVIGIVFVVAVLALVAGALIYAAVSGRSGRQREGGEGPRAATAATPEPTSFRDRLRLLQESGRWPELFRLLDRTLPEWVVAGSLMEAVRELAALEEGIARARGNGVSEEVTGRLALHIETVSSDLWSLAERIFAADRIGSRDVREELERHDEALVRLRDGIHEAREGLAGLSLSDVAGWDDLRLADGKFRSLAATARELHEWERDRVPW